MGGGGIGIIDAINAVGIGAEGGGILPLGRSEPVEFLFGLGVEVAFGIGTATHDVEDVAVFGGNSGRVHWIARNHIPGTGVADAVIMAKLVDIHIGAVVVLHPESVIAGQARIGNGAGGHADAREGDAHDVVVASAEFVAAGVVAHRADVDGGIGSGFGIAEGVAGIANQFVVLCVGAAVGIVGSGLWHGVEIGTGGGLDPGLTVGLLADAVADRAVHHGGRGGLSDRLG